MAIRSSRLLSIVLVVSVLVSGFSLPVHAASKDAIVEVDFSNSIGELYRSERYFNTSKWATYAEQREADKDFFFVEEGLRSKILKLWCDDIDIYDPDTDTYDFSAYEDYFRISSEMAESVILNFRAEKVMKELRWSPAQTKPVVKTILKWVKENYPVVEYIEILNEPDYTPMFGGAVTAENYYSFYKVYYEAINEINAELNPDVPLKCGGPAISGWDTNWFDTFFRDYAADPSPDKRLDFISYHVYYLGTIENISGFVKSDPSVVTKYRDDMDDLLAKHGLDQDIPIFFTETGMYPGPLGDNGGLGPDQLRQAAGMASLNYYFSQDSRNYMFNWVLRHKDAGRKDALVTRDNDNQLYDPIPTRKFTPYGNMLKMMSLMKDEQVAASTDSLAAGRGVYSTASKDYAGASIMVWNYQPYNRNVVDDDYNVQIKANNLPSIFDGQDIRVRTYRVDDETGNWYYDPDTCNDILVDESVVSHDGSLDIELHLKANSVHLLVLEPENMSDSDQALVTLSGDDTAEIETEAQYILNVANVKRLATATLWVEVDSAYLNRTVSSVEGLNGFDVIGDMTWEAKTDSLWTGRVTIGNLDGGISSKISLGMSGQGGIDILALTMGVKEKLGETQVKITRIDLSGYDENDDAIYLSANIRNGSVTTKVIPEFSQYDVNRDGVVDQLDLTTAQLYYAAREGDANWDKAQIADVNDDGRVDIEDLILILNNIVW